MPGPYRDDLEAVRERVRREERANAPTKPARARIFEPAQLVLAGVFLLIGGLFAVLRGQDDRPATFSFAGVSLEPAELQAPLEELRLDVMSTCGLPHGTTVDIYITVQNGWAMSRSIATFPDAKPHHACIDRELRRARWQRSPIAQKVVAHWSRD